MTFRGCLIENGYTVVGFLSCGEGRGGLDEENEDGLNDSRGPGLLGRCLLRWEVIFI